MDRTRWHLFLRADQSPWDLDCCYFEHHTDRRKFTQYWCRPNVIKKILFRPLERSPLIRSIYRHCKWQTQGLNMKCSMRLFITIGDPRVRSWFEIVESSAVGVLLGALFINLCVCTIFQQGEKLSLDIGGQWRLLQRRLKLIRDKPMLQYSRWIKTRTKALKAMSWVNTALWIKWKYQSILKLQYWSVSLVLGS